MNRIRGLDSIRAFLALWVAMNHVIPPPLLHGIDTDSRIGWLLQKAYGLCINGQAAVIGFFVMSGFCVHLPYRETGPERLRAYFFRRYVRVAIPFVIVLLLTNLLPADDAKLERGIFWSVYAELIYYTLYPLIYRIRRLTGWNVLLGLSILLMPIVLFANHPNGNYHDAGDALAWILGLPCWLLGCKLAEEFDKPRAPVGVLDIWKWRLAVWAASVFCYVLRFHTPIKHYYSLNLFAILVYLWIAREIRYYKAASPPRWLESAGAWSYSLYLTHFFGSVLFVIAALPNLGYLLNWVIRCSFVFCTAYCYYLAVERPSHQLARFLARESGRKIVPVLPVNGEANVAPAASPDFRPSLTALSAEES
jgi:peptidoglycan/LPS O-acetylase OafA/YrhL